MIYGHETKLKPKIMKDSEGFFIVWSFIVTDKRGVVPQFISRMPDKTTALKCISSIEFISDLQVACGAYRGSLLDLGYDAIVSKIDRELTPQCEECGHTIHEIGKCKIERGDGYRGAEFKEALGPCTCGVKK